MSIRGIDHVNIDTDDLDATVAFYEGLLGLRSAPKPSGMPGVWLYSGDQAVVHVMMVDKIADGHPANFNHVAFQAEGLDSMLERLEAAGVEFTAVPRPKIGVTLVSCFDPNGVPVELVFPLDA